MVVPSGFILSMMFINLFNISRMDKNREAAQAFRQRQRAHVDTLEKEIKELGAYNQQATQKAEDLLNKNKQMQVGEIAILLSHQSNNERLLFKIVQEQLQYLKSFMKQAVSFTFDSKSELGKSP